MPYPGKPEKHRPSLAAERPPLITIGDLTLDRGTHEVSRAGKTIRLPKLSYRLFAELVSAAPGVLSHDDLVERVWDSRPTSAETVTQRVMLLRRALGDDASNPRYVGLVRGQGYRMLQPARERRTTAGMSAQPAAVRPYLAAAAVVVAAALWFAYVQIMPGSSLPIPLDTTSIAVLPLESNDIADGDVFFVDGMHNDILTRLAGIESLRVVSRTTVERLRDTEMTIREIGASLGVDAVLEGGVQRIGDRIRVNMQLIDTATDTALWAGSFDEELTVANIFSIQSAVAEEVSRATQTMLAGEDIERVPTDSLAAYEAYLRGAQLLRRRTGATIESAIAHFSEAIRLDPEFAQPYTGLADAYQLLMSYASRPARDVLPHALAAAEIAIELEPESGEAYASLAMIYAEASRVPEDIIEIEDPEPIFKRAIRLSPNYATAYQWYGEYLSLSGRPADASAMFERAIEIDPLSPILNHMYAHSLRRTGRLAEAEKHFLKAVQIDPGFSRAYQGLAAHYFVSLGRVGDAVLAAEQAALLNRGEATNFSMLANFYTHLGDEAEAERWLAEANRIAEDAYFSIYATTIFHLYRGDHSAAVETARKGAAKFPRGQLFVSVLKNHYLREGRADSAIRLYDEAFPELLSATGDEITRYSTWPAVDYAYLLQQTGREAEAQGLLERVADALADESPRGDHRHLILNAAIHTLSDQTHPALDSLQQAVDLGWRRGAFYHFDEDPNFDAIRNEPQFQSMAASVRADLAMQYRELTRTTRPAIVLGSSAHARQRDH